MTRKAASNLGILDDTKESNSLPSCLQLGASCDCKHHLVVVSPPLLNIHGKILSPETAAIPEISWFVDAHFVIIWGDMRPLGLPLAC